MFHGPRFIGNERIDLDLCEECNEEFKNKEREITIRMHEFYINELKRFIKNKDINIEEESKWTSKKKDY